MTENATEKELAPEEVDSVTPDRDKGGGLFAFPKPSGGEWSKDEAVADLSPEEPVTPRKRGRPPGSKNKTTGEMSLPKLEKELKNQLALLGMGVSMFNKFDGKVILTRADDTSKALVKLAEDDPKVRKILEGFCATSNYGQVILVFASVCVPIAANHGLAPEFAAGLFGSPLPKKEKEDEPQ